MDATGSRGRWAALLLHVSDGQTWVGYVGEGDRQTHRASHSPLPRTVTSVTFSANRKANKEDRREQNDVTGNVSDSMNQFCSLQQEANERQGSKPGQRKSKLSSVSTVCCPSGKEPLSSPLSASDTRQRGFCLSLVHTQVLVINKGSRHAITWFPCRGNGRKPRHRVQ